MSPHLTRNPSRGTLIIHNSNFQTQGRELGHPSGGRDRNWGNGAINAHRLYPSSWMIKDKLRLNDNKTEFMIIGTRKQLAKVNIDGLSVGESIIAPVTSVRNLGSWFDQNLSMIPHIIITGAPNVNFRKISVRKTIGDLEFSEHLL